MARLGIRRSISIGALLAVVALLVLAAPTLAKERPINMDIFACERFGGQNPWAVAANTPVGVTEIWGAKTFGQEQAWVAASELTVAVNGVPVNKPESYFQPPQLGEDGLWSVVWLYPTGVSVKAGGTISVYFKHVLTQPVFDGFGHYPAGTFVDVTCTAKALPSS